MVLRRFSAVAAPLAIVVYAILWAGAARHWHWLQGADDRAVRQFLAFGADRAEWVALWQVITTVLSPNGMRFIAAVVVAAALVRPDGASPASWRSPSD